MATDMEYRTLGRSGLHVSAIGLGCNNLSRPGTASESQDGTSALIVAALDSGITFFDTAEMYGGGFGRSEQQLGEALRGRRDSAIIATKFGHADYPTPIESWGARASRRYIRQAVEGSLRRLQTEWIDLYQLHTPDPSTPIEETILTLDSLVDEGKIRYIGHSNLAAWQLADADHIARSAGAERFISTQNEYSLLERGVEREVVPAARHFGLGLLPFFPLSNGVFTGKYTREGGPEGSRIMRQKRHLLETVPWERVDRFASFADERGLTMLEATMGWLLSHDAVSSVIAGATTPEQVRQNAAAAARWRPTPAELAEIDEIFPAP